MIQIGVRVITLLYGLAQLFYCSIDIADVCPLTSFCADRRSVLNTTHQSNSCCLPCSCHKNCKLVGTCCHDAEIVDRIQYSYPCSSQEDIYIKYLSLEFRSSKPAAYGRVITDCHYGEDDYSNETISRCRNAHNLEDLAFVTGKSSGITYINRHCALCNGEYDVDVWNLKMVSRNAEDLFSINASFEARDEYILRTGSVMSFPPTAFAELSTFCNINMYASCNISRKWTIYNKDIVDKCNYFNSVYYETERGRFYKNPFCYICNSSPKDTIVNKNCGNVADNLSVMRSGINDFIFTTLLTTRETRQNNAKPRSECQFGETMDPFLVTCTKLLCPLGTVVVDDFCEPMFPEDSGITLVVSFSIVFEDLIADIEVQRHDVNFLQELRKIIVSKVKEYDRRCDFCQSMINEDLVFSIAFKSSPSCRYLKYLNIIAMLQKETPVQVFSSYFQGNVSLEGGNFTNCVFKRVIVAENRKNEDICDFQVQFNNKIIPCPSILISMSKLEVLSLTQRTRDEIQRIGTDVGNGTLRVCLEEYNKIYARSSSSVASYMMSYYILAAMNILLSYNSPFHSDQLVV